MRRPAAWITLFAAAGLLALGHSVAARAAGLTTVKFVYDWPNADFEIMPIVVAQQRGYYAAAGLKTDVAFPPDSQTTARILASGQADIGFEGTTDIVFAAQQGVPVISIAAYTQGNDWCLVGRPGEAIDLHHLAGKSIAIFTDSWTKAMMPFVLKAGGVKASQVKLIIATSDDIQLLLSHKIDIATNTSNYAMAEVMDGVHKKPTLVCAPAFGAPDVPVWAYTASTGWLARHGAVAKRWLAATRKGMAWAAAHPKQAVALLHKAYPDTGSTEYSLIGWQETIPLLKGKNGYLNQTAAQWTALATALKDTKQLPAVLPADKYFTNAYLTP